MSGMKKLLSTGLLALLTTAYLTSSCSRDDFSGSIIEAKKQAFSDNFKAAYGNINPLQDWGFGSATTRGWAFTRGVNTDFPGETSFRDNLAANNITAPAMPDFPDALPTTGVTYAGSVTSWTNGMSVYLDKNTTSAEAKDNLKIYITENLTYTGGISGNGDGTTFIVLKGKKLTLNTTAQNMKIYLAPEAILDMSGTGFGQFDNSKAGLFMKAGSKVFAGNLDFFQGWTVLNQGGYISASNVYVQKGSMLWNEGEIILSGALSTQNENSIIYNESNHRIKASSLTLNNNSELFYNNGTATFTGAIEQDNNGGEIINNDTLSGSSMLIKAGGKMHNVGTTTITGLTKVDNTGTQWQNDEIFTTGDFEVSAYAEEVYNNCKLTVHKTGDTGLFKIYGKFVLQGGDPNDATKSGASVITDNLEWTNNTYMFLGTKSLLKVNKQFLSNNAVDNSALVGPTNGYAVVQAESITRPEANMAKQFGMTYLNNLLVDAGSHFPQGAEDPDNNPPAQPYYKYDESVIFKEAGETTTVTIPQTKCNPGYNTTGGGGDDETTVRVVLKECGRIFCEDLGNVSNKDMDYNDVVFDAWIYVKQTLVNDVVTSESHYRTFIQLLAAGGTLPINVGNLGDVHTIFGAGENDMVNTYVAGYSEVREELCVEKALPDELVIRNELDEFYAREGGVCLKNIPIFVKQGSEVDELDADMGDAPHKFCAVIGTKWVGERIEIGSAYTGFTGWVSKNIEPWSTGVNNLLYDFDYTPTHGETMEYDPNDDPSTTSGSTSGTGGSSGGSTTGGTSFNNVTGTVVYNTQTQLTSGSGITISSSEFNDAAAADIYIYGTGTGNVEVNGAPAEDVSGTSGAPIYNFTRGFGFTRSAETPVVKKCTLGPKQFHGNDIGIRGNNFTVYKVSYTATQPSVSQPTGTVLVSNANGIEMDWAQRGQQHISADKLTGIGEGTIIRVAGVGYADNTDASNNTSWQVELDIENPWTKIGAKTYWTEDYATGAVTVAFVLTAEQAEALLNSQLCVQGVNFILKYVTVDNSNVTPSGSDVDIPGTAVWTIDSYSGQEQKIESTALSALDTSKAAHLVIYGRHTTNWWEIQVMHDWANILTARSDNSYGSCGHWENSDINVASDGVIIIPLTAAQVTLLRQDGMRVYLGAVTVSKMELRQ